MLVILFKNVKNFIQTQELFKILEEIKYSKENYESVKKQVENT